MVNRLKKSLKELSVSLISGLSLGCIYSLLCLDFLQPAGFCILFITMFCVSTLPVAYLVQYFNNLKGGYWCAIVSAFGGLFCWVFFCWISVYFMDFSFKFNHGAGAYFTSIYSTIVGGLYGYQKLF